MSAYLKRNQRERFLLPGSLLILYLVLGATPALGQGGTGREVPKTPPKTAPPAKSKTPPKRNTSTSRPSSCTAQSPKQATGRTHTVNLNGGLRLEMVEIPTGSFCMGSTNGAAYEKPVHQVTIGQAFYMGKYEVTQAEWQAVMGNNPSNFKDCGGNCPVEQVSWDDAQSFINKLNESNDGFRYRLPTEAEWEYACRAGTTRDYAGNLSEMAWYSDNSGSKTHAVGGKRPNAWGLADMHGNVSEWCQDWFHGTYSGAPTDGRTWLSGGEQKYRMLRGGSWRDFALNLRSAGRGWNPPDNRFSDNFGFRVVAVAQTQPQTGAEEKSNTNPTSNAGSNTKNPALPAAATLDADPLLFPPDTRPIPYGDPKSKSTQEPAEAKVFAGKDVDQRARVFEKPPAMYTDDARKNSISGTVILRAVLASSGHVTNIQVIRSLPNGLTEKAIEAAKKLKFVPAVKDGHPVSQHIELQYTFSPY